MPRNAPSKSSSKTTSRRPSHKASEDDALRILAEDHKKVTDLFDEFERMKENEETDDEAKQVLVETACAELTIHAQVEEEIFYPAARDAIEDMDLLDEAEVEHASARQLITELAAMQPGDDLYDAKFTVLGEYVKHHIQEEEKELFPKIKKSELDLEELGREISERKLELRDEFGVSGEDEDDDDPDSGAGAKRRVH
ncbi:hemerythrin domain-containing protein [Noviherbaspirillum denitrificans]|uniref:hemerythrin domain-containing protein n=1 Tax=Noviherbaspirillum denitrificans TaxID=1968433 RepID=UPI000B52DB39|nr:hemerythrin domain-containing protein [Noviherbaspirillum denitrificans]